MFLMIEMYGIVFEFFAFHLCNCSSSREVLFFIIQPSW